MKTTHLLLFLCLTHTLTGQVSTVALNAQDKKHFQTIISISKYLKAQKTIPLAFHESATYTKEESFYDEVVDKYFEKKKLYQLLTKDTLVFAVDGKMDILRHILNGADYFLDVIPSDSVFVRPFNSKELQNVLEVYLIVNSREISMLLCEFDPYNSLLICLTGGTSPRTDEFMAYLRRQINYYEFPDPFRKN